MPFDSILFRCGANSARSQMAEGLARKRFGDAVRPLDEVLIDASAHSSKHVTTIDPGSVDQVITLCAEESCPVFLGDARRMSWAIPDLVTAARFYGWLLGVEAKEWAHRRANPPGPLKQPLAFDRGCLADPVQKLRHV